MNSDVRQHAVGRNAQRTFNREPASTFVPATTEYLGDSGHIDCSFAAQADAKALIRQLTEERRDLDPADAQRVIYKSLQIFFNASAPLDIMHRYIHPCQLALTVQIIQRITQQTHLRCRTAEVNALRNLYRIG